MQCKGWSWSMWQKKGGNTRGVNTDTWSKQKAQCLAAFGKGNRVWGCIYRGINYKSKELVLTGCKNLVRPYLAYCARLGVVMVWVSALSLECRQFELWPSQRPYKWYVLLPCLMLSTWIGESTDKHWYVSNQSRGFDVGNHSADLLLCWRSL